MNSALLLQNRESLCAGSLAGSLVVNWLEGVVMDGVGAGLSVWVDGGVTRVGSCIQKAWQSKLASALRDVRDVHLSHLVQYAHATVGNLAS